MDFKLNNNQIVRIREVLVSDAPKVINYMKLINLETKNLLREPNEFTMTVEEEEAFLTKVISSKDEYMLTVWDEDKLISVTGFHGSKLQRITHRVSFGMSVLAAYQNLGLGTKLMEILCSKAKEMGKLKMELDVREDNEAAIHIYEKAGFKIEGNRIKGFKIDGEYINLILMGKIL